MRHNNAFTASYAKGLVRIAPFLASLLTTPLHAATLTVQIDGVEDNLQAAVTASAEIAQYSGRDISAAQVRRLYANAPEQVAKALEAYGYYGATATGELKETPQGFTAVLQDRRASRLSLRPSRPSASLLRLPAQVSRSRD